MIKGLRTLLVLCTMTVGVLTLPNMKTDPMPAPLPVAAMKPAKATMKPAMATMKVAPATMHAAMPSAAPAAGTINNNTNPTANPAIIVVDHTTSSKCLCSSGSSWPSYGGTSYSSSNNDIVFLSKDIGSVDVPTMYSSMMTCASSSNVTGAVAETGAESVGEATPLESSAWSCDMSSPATMVDWSVYAEDSSSSEGTSSCSSSEDSSLYRRDHASSPSRSDESGSDPSSYDASSDDSSSYDSSSSDSSSYDSSSSDSSSYESSGSCDGTSYGYAKKYTPTDLGVVKILATNTCMRKVWQAKGQIVTTAVVQVFLGRQTTAIVIAQTALTLKSGKIQTRIAQILIKTTVLTTFQTKWAQEPAWTGMESSEISKQESSYNSADSESSSYDSSAPDSSYKSADSESSSYDSSAPDSSYKSADSESSSYDSSAPDPSYNSADSESSSYDSSAPDSSYKPADSASSSDS
ncbi:hypothetical protein SeMB42_g01881 [Synchytrium endobioticum]|uniref:REJ domain-containing protein n=1 Tax=Synchytrium endobioticum TaxID=286115 RepID=A0A507DJ36_9FUNG|nr:hypothetical protein SeMB42_g01881 [Synchytrium endobioticum]